MTTDFYSINNGFLRETSNKIINEVKALIDLLTILLQSHQGPLSGNNYYFY